MRGPEKGPEAIAKRLAEDPGAPAELRAMIAAARADAPAPAALERVLARVEGSGGPTPGAAVGGHRLLLLAGGAGLALAVAVVLIARGRAGSDERPPATTPTATATPIPTATPNPTPNPIPNPTTTTTPNPTATPIPRATPTPIPIPTPSATPSATPIPTPIPRGAAPRAHRKARPVRAPVGQPASELALIERARAALAAGDLPAALAAAGSHRASYPQGVLAEEREAIAIEALARAGQAAGARARLAGFLGRFPRSGYRRHLEELVPPP